MQNQQNVFQENQPCRVEGLPVRGLYRGTAEEVGKGCVEIQVTNNTAYCRRNDFFVINAQKLIPA